MASAPGTPELQFASGTSERMGLVQDWLDYLLQGAEGGTTFVVFQSDNDYYVQFAVEAAGRRIHAEIGTFEWEKRLGAPLPESAVGRLTGKGFERPERAFANYWQNFDQTRPGSLAQITEWAFREVFGERAGFTLRVSNFRSDTRNVLQKVGDAGKFLSRELLRDRTRDELCAHLRALGIEAQMAERGRTEEGVGGEGSLGVIDIIDGPIGWVNVRKEARNAGAGGGGTTYYDYTDYGVPGPMAAGSQMARIICVGARTFPLFGKVVDVHWKGDDLGLGIINRLNGDISTKDPRVSSCVLDIRPYPKHECWIISTKTGKGPPSEELWRCYQAIAQQLLDTALRS